MLPKVYDCYGVEKPWSWLVQKYGELQIHSFPEDEPGWRIVRIDENADRELSRVGVEWANGFIAHVAGLYDKPVEIGKINVAPEYGDSVMVDGVLAPAIIITTVLDEEGHPVEGMPVCWYWPDASKKEGCIPLNGLEPGIIAGRYDGPGLTNGNGQVGMAMGGGAYYTPPEIGPHAIWPCVGVNADSARGYGMLGWTNHFSLWPTYQYVAEGGAPPDCNQDAIRSVVQAIRNRLTRVFSDLEDIENLLP